MSESMFPAPAGMSPGVLREYFWALDVPRTRGDEPPAIQRAALVGQCSPHPRG